MDWDQIERNWKQAQQKIKRKWVRLTDADLNTIKGRRDGSRIPFTSATASRPIIYAKKSNDNSVGKAEIAVGALPSSLELAVHGLGELGIIAATPS